MNMNTVKLSWTKIWYTTVPANRIKTVRKGKEKETSRQHKAIVLLAPQLAPH